MKLQEKLNSLGIVLPSVPGPFGAYVPAKRSGNLIFVAGQLPLQWRRVTESPLLGPAGNKEFLVLIEKTG